MSGPRDERGFTLIEVMIAVALLGIIIVPLTGAIVNGFRITTDAQTRLSEGRSPLFTSAYFADDAQSSDANRISLGGAPACGGGTNIVSFTWTENTTQYRSSYATNVVNGKRVLTRSYCGSSGTQVATVAPVLSNTTPTVTCADRSGTPVACNPGTSALRTVTLVAATPNNENYFTLTATRRAT
jgi:prepilin-type N-terminal cleavage/methylation domain-containing protein